MKTGHAVEITKAGTASILPRGLSETRFVGPLAATQDRWVKEYERSHPGQDSSRLRDFFRSQQEGSFPFGEKTYLRFLHRPEMTTIKIVQKATVDTIFVFKLTYEFLAMTGILPDDSIFSAMNDKFEINLQDPKSRILFDRRKIEKRVLTNTGIDFKDYRKLQNIPFLPTHYFMLRLTPSGVLYLKVCLFGQVKVFYIIEKIDKLSDAALLLLEKVVEVPLGENLVRLDVYPNLSRIACVLTYDRWVDDTYVDVLSH